jgi:hypothetical protein
MESSNSDDVDFQIVDVDSQIRNVAATLAARRGQPSFTEYLLDRNMLSSLIPASRLRMMKLHLERLQDSGLTETASAQQPQTSSCFPMGTTPAATLLPQQKACLPAAPQLPRHASSPQRSESAVSETAVEVSPPSSDSSPSETIPPPPPYLRENCGKKAVSQATALWNFLVKEHKSPGSLDKYKTALGTVKQAKLIQAFAASLPGTNYNTVRNYVGPGRRFSWAQVLSAAGIGPKTARHPFTPFLAPQTPLLPPTPADPYLERI